MENTAKMRKLCWIGTSWKFIWVWLWPYFQILTKNKKIFYHHGSIADPMPNIFFCNMQFWLTKLIQFDGPTKIKMNPSIHLQKEMHTYIPLKLSLLQKQPLTKSRKERCVHIPKHKLRRWLIISFVVFKLVPSWFLLLILYQVRACSYPWQYEWFESVLCCQKTQKRLQIWAILLQITRKLTALYATRFRSWNVVFYFHFSDIMVLS